MTTQLLPLIDVSNNQGVIDWPRVAQTTVRHPETGEPLPIVGAIIKASEGPDNETGEWFPDAYFPTNWHRAPNVGLFRFAYHFARPSKGGAEEEASFFLARISDAGSVLTEDGLVLDMEDRRVPRGVDLYPWTMQFLRFVEREVGFRPLFYSNYYYMQDHNLLDKPDLAEYGLWLANYQTSVPPTPPPWPRITMWQYSETGSVPGVNGACDLNWFFGTADELRAYGKPAAPPALTGKARGLAMCDVVWGVGNLLDGIKSPYGQELRDAVVAIKQEAGWE